jgi:FSR family fosmidomycin resistance protein-like MFS transporter
VSVGADSLRRDVRVISLVGTAHFVSHFFQLALPPLFPVLKAELGVAYVALGLMMSLFYAASGIGQTAAGFLVDRFGARPILLGGMGLLAGSIALAGFSASYFILLPIAVLAGLGNSVFHPADYAIFNASITPSRLGRAYSVHGICGNLGWAVAPAVIVTLGGLFGWRPALVMTGGLGLAVTLLLAIGGEALADDRQRGPARGGSRPAGLAHDLRVLLVAPVLVAFAYFALLATALIGLQTFSVAAMVAVYAAPLTLATGALTGFLLGSSAGILLGGMLADRTSRHDVVAGGGMLLAAAMTLSIATGALPLALLAVAMVLAGFCLGVTSPSRDMLVRAATPRGASGKVYGFVYSGLDLGSSVTPLVFGWLLDLGAPRTIFVVAAGLMLLTIVTVVQVRRHGAPAAARLGASVS